MILKKSISWLLISVLLFSVISTGQDMLARAEAKTDVETVEEKMFDIIKEENESPNKITGNFLEPKNNDGVYYAAKGYLGWTFNYGPTSGSVKVSVESTTHPEIINPNTMRVKLPQERTEVTISGKLEPINDGTGQAKSFNMTVAVMPRDSVKLPIDKVGDVLFEAIKGENSSADNITKYLNRLKNKNKTTAFINPYNGQISFEEDKNGIDIEFISSDDESVLNHETLKINFPQTEKKVNLTARLTHKHGGYDEEKTVVLPLVIKGRDVNPIGEEVTFTNEVKRKLFEAIKGKNESPDNIENDLQLPKGSLPIYAVGSIDNINWKSGHSYYYKAKVDFENCDHPQIVDLSDLSITRPAADTVVTLTGKITPKNHTHGDIENFSISLNIKAKKKPKNYLEEIDEVKLFQAIKGENTDKDSIKYDLKRPVEAEPFYAKLTESGLEWQTEKAGAHLKIETKESTNPELLEPAALKIKRGEADANVGLKFEVTDLTRTEGEGEPTKKEVTVELKIKAKPKQLPPELKAGIAEEKRLFDAVRADFFRGLDVYGKNIDENNIVRSMDIQFKEAYFDGEGRLYFEPDAHNIKRRGIKLSNKEIQDRSFFIEYPDGGNGLFHPYNLVLQNRPATDTRVRIGHYVESFKYQKYMEEYPEDEELQQLKKQIFWKEVIVKAINADVEKISAAGESIDVVKGKTHYSVLTDDEKISTEVTVSPKNRGAQIMIAGSKLDKRFSRNISLKNGFAKVGILVSDEDYLENGTRKETELSLSIVSKSYLESEIAKLPQATESSEADRKKAEKLIIQLESLETEDADKIEGRDKLNAYRQETDDILKEEKERLNKVEARLFDAIKAENNDKDSVFKNMEGKYYAKVEGEEVDITKEASDSDVRIEWLSSSHPHYINVLPGYDFESQYAQAFHIRRRPQAESGDTKVKFRARLHSIAEPGVKKEVDIDFKLLAYNAQLKAVEADGASSNINIMPDKSEYEITYKTQGGQNPASIKMKFFSKMPDVKFDFGTELNELIGKYESGRQVDIPLDSNGKAEINLTVTEGFKSSYFNNWAEKKYVFKIAPEEGKLELGRIVAHAGEEVEIKPPEGLSSSQIKWVATDNKLAAIEDNKLKLKHPGSFEIIGKYGHKEYIYKVIVRPKSVKAFGGRIKNGYVKLDYEASEGSDGVFIYRGLKKDGKYRFAFYHEEKKGKTAPTGFFVPKGKTYCFYIKSYTIINGYKYVSKRSKKMYFAGKR